jgi:hypothetical protein
LVVLVAVGAVLAAQREWPFSKSSARSVARASGEGSAGWKGRPERTRPAEEIWSGEVSLVLNQRYGLNKRPGNTLEPCGACLTVGSTWPDPRVVVRSTTRGPDHLDQQTGAGHTRKGRLFLHSDNGILPWPKRERPSYYDCIHQRESGTLDAVTLETSPNHGGVAVHGWICATGNEDNIIRLQYQGQGPGSNDPRFTVTTWHRPFA